MDTTACMINHVDHTEQVEGLKVLAPEVGQIAYGVHEYFGTGLLEKVYETAFEHRLQKYINDSLVVELKATAALLPEHLAQIINYLKIVDKPVGLLVNFGSRKFERRTVYR